jgi:hypothetical protein
VLVLINVIDCRECFGARARLPRPNPKARDLHHATYNPTPSYKSFNLYTCFEPSPASRPPVSQSIETSRFHFIFFSPELGARLSDGSLDHGPSHLGGRADDDGVPVSEGTRGELLLAQLLLNNLFTKGLGFSVCGACLGNVMPSLVCRGHSSSPRHPWTRTHSQVLPSQSHSVGWPLASFACQIPSRDRPTTAFRL